MATGIDIYKLAVSDAVDSSHVRLQADANGLLCLVDSSSVQYNIGEFYLTTELDDVSTASSAWIAAPAIGTITTLKTILHTAITVADAAITAEIGGTAITGIAITITQSGSAAGDVDTDTATAANTLAVNDALEFISDGGSTTAARLTGTFLVERC